MSNGIEWSLEDYDRLAKLCAAGATIESLCGAFPDRTRRAIQSKAWKCCLPVIYPARAKPERPSWPEDRLQEMRQRWNDGESHSRIAQALETTPSAVAGALSRYRTGTDRFGEVRAPASSQPINTTPATLTASLISLEARQCRFIEGEAYCGAACSGTYCARHRALMVQPFTRKTTPNEFVRSCRRYA